MRNKANKAKASRKRAGPDQAFGCDLTEHLLATGQDVPQVLRSCAEFIEEHGVVDGIYRLSGVTSNIQKLRQEFEVCDSCPELTKEMYLQDIHCVGSLCKLYFRELPNPLLTYELYKKFTDSVSLKGEREQLRHIQGVIKELPEAHFRTLEYLSRHLSHLATLSHMTNMHARNLALVWAPNLLRCKDMEQASSCSGDSAFLEVRVQQSVVEFILKNTHHIFGAGEDQRSPTLQAPGPPVCEKYATLPVSSSTSCGALKLMSLEEAQARSLGNKHPARQRENSLPDTRTAATLYHTVIDLDTKRKLSSKSSKRWKSIFGLGRSAKLSRNGSVLVRTQDNDKAAIRPSKSMDSICSVSPDGDMSSPSNSRDSVSGGGACNGLPMKSRTLGSEADFSLSDENLKVWGFSPKGARKSAASGTASSPGNQPSSDTSSTGSTSQKTLPEQLKVFKGGEASGSFRPTSPKNRRMLFSSSSHHGSGGGAGGGAVVGSAPHLSFFPLESPSLSPRHQRKALNISEPFAVSVPLRVSAVISANSTPCRPGGPLAASSASSSTAQGLKPAAAASTAKGLGSVTEPGPSGGQGAHQPDASPSSSSSSSSSQPSPSGFMGATSQDVTSAMVVGASGQGVPTMVVGASGSASAMEGGGGSGGIMKPPDILLAGLEEMLSEVGATAGAAAAATHTSIRDNPIPVPIPHIPAQSQSNLIPNIPSQSQSQSQSQSSPIPSIPSPQSRSSPNQKTPSTSLSPSQSKSSPIPTVRPPPQSQFSPIPFPTAKVLGAVAIVTAEPGESASDEVSNAPLHSSSTKDNSADNANPSTGPLTPPALAQSQAADPGHGHTIEAQAVGSAGPQPQQMSEPKPRKQSSTAPPPEPSNSEMGTITRHHTTLVGGVGTDPARAAETGAEPTVAPGTGTELGPSGSVAEPGQSGRQEELGDVQRSRGDEATADRQRGSQAESQQGAMATGDEQQIVSKTTTQASSLPGSPGHTPSVGVDQSDQISAAKDHQAPPHLVPEFAPPPLSSLGALRETDILSDHEETLTSPTSNQSLTPKQTGARPSPPEPVEVVGSSAVPCQTSCESAENAKDSREAEGNAKTSCDDTGLTPQAAATKDFGHRDVVKASDGPEKTPTTEEEEQRAEEREQQKSRRRGGKERKQKGGREREKGKGLEQVEVWDDPMHSHWVTSPLHTPTLEEMFSGLASQRKKKGVSQATVSQPPPDAALLHPHEKTGPLAKTSGVFRRPEAPRPVSRRNSSPHISLHQSVEARADPSSQNAVPVVQWALKVPSSTAAARRFHRQASCDASLYPSPSPAAAPPRLHTTVLEQKRPTAPRHCGPPAPSPSSVPTTAARHRPCSLDLERDLDLDLVQGGLSSLQVAARVIRDISNQPSAQQHVATDAAGTKGHRELSSAPWHTKAVGGSADFSEELELFLGNPRAPARRNSAPPPVGVASVRAPLTIRTSQARAVPVIPPKLQYSSMPGSTGSDLRNLPEDRKDSGNVPEGRKDSKAGGEEKTSSNVSTATTPEAPPTPLTPSSEEERENREPVAMVTPLSTATPAPPTSPAQADAPLLRRKPSPTTADLSQRRKATADTSADQSASFPDQMVLPLSGSALLRQRPSFRNRPRPQSLVLFSPPFPIMDPPNNNTSNTSNNTNTNTNSANSTSSAALNSSASSHQRPAPRALRAAVSLGRAASFWDRPTHRQDDHQSGRPGGESSTRERRKSSEGAGGSVGGSAGGKMTLPKSGQRLETSPSSCFYQPQRRSMVIENRQGRQIE